MGSINEIYYGTNDIMSQNDYVYICEDEDDDEEDVTDENVEDQKVPLEEIVFIENMFQIPDD